MWYFQNKAAAVAADEIVDRVDIAPAAEIVNVPSAVEQIANVSEPPAFFDEENAKYLNKHHND